MATTKKQQDSGNVSDGLYARDGELLSDGQRLRLCEMAEAGASVRDIGDALGVSIASVSRYAKRLGVSFDRSRTDAATAAKVADGRARRAELSAQLLEQLGAELARLNRPLRVHAFLSGPNGGYKEHVLPQPDPASRLALSRSFHTLLQSYLRLAGLEDDDSLDHTKSMIGQLAADIRTWAAANPVPEEADRAEA